MNKYCWLCARRKEPQLLELVETVSQRLVPPGYYVCEQCYESNQRMMNRIDSLVTALVRDTNGLHITPGLERNIQIGRHR